MILPDIEKRLEAFVRLGHGIVVFPGGVGTAEEILYLLGILLDPAERARSRSRSCSPARAAARSTSQQIDAFLVGTLGERVRQCYRIIIGDPAEVAREMLRGMDARARVPRGATSDAYNFNWLLRIPHELQQPFEPTHEAMARAQPPPRSARRTSWRPTCAARSPASSPATSRKRACARSSEHGPFELHGDPAAAAPARRAAGVVRARSVA